MSESPLIRSLNELCLFLDQAGIDYMLIGGLAVGIWGQPRATVDIDFMISVSTDDFESFRSRATESEQFIFLHNKPMTLRAISLLRATLRENPDISVDFLFADNEYARQALKRKERVSLKDFSVNITTPEDLILLKLLSGREQDWIDAAKVLEIQAGRLDKKYLTSWATKHGIEKLLTSLLGRLP